MKVPDSWVQGELAVNVFDRLCIKRKWPFIAAPANRDFGKDGYVDISEGDVVTGESFFVQIKGGRSYTLKDGYTIPVGDHAEAWRRSPAAVIGVVIDPKDERARWVNLTAALRADPTAKSVHVDAAAVLDDDRQAAALLASVRSTTVDRYVPVGLGSKATRDQAEAVWEAFAMGHRNAEPLIAVRRAFLALDRSAAAEAIYALSLCTPHPDIFWSKDNWLPPGIQNWVAGTYRWSVHDVCQLLEHVREGEGLLHGLVTSELACPRGGPERMSTCPSPIRRSSVMTSCGSLDAAIRG